MLLRPQGSSTEGVPWSWGGDAHMWGVLVLCAGPKPAETGQVPEAPQALC